MPRARTAKRFFSPKLGVEILEDRITPDSKTFGGLFFDAGANPLATGPVTVHLASGQPAALKVASGVSFSGSDFSATGVISAASTGGSFIPVLNAAARTFNTANLNAVASPIAAGVSVTGGATVSVLKSNFTPTNLKIVGSNSAPVVQMQGDVSFSGFNGLSVPLPPAASMQISAGIGARYNADFQFSVPQTKFDFKMLQVETSVVSGGYVQATNTFHFSGGAKVTNKVDETKVDSKGDKTTKTFDNVSAQLGDGTTKGITITNGELAGAHIAVTGKLNFKKLKLGADDLTISYDASASRLQFSGGVSLGLGKSIVISAALTNPVAIDTTTGDISLPDGLGIKGALKIGKFGGSVDIKYQSDGATGYTLYAGVELDLRGFKVGGTFTLVDGALSAIGLSYDKGDADKGIPLGSSGLFISKISGNVINIDNPGQIEVAGSISVYFGKTIRVLGVDYSIFDATASFKITPNSVDITGNVNLVGGLLGSGNGSINIDWDQGQYRVHVDAELLSVFRFTGDLDFDNAGNITLNAQAKVQFPSSIPLIGGATISSANVYMQIRPDEDFSSTYIAAWTSLNLGVATPTVGFQYAFDRTLTFLTSAPAKSEPYVAPPLDATYPNQASADFTVAAEPGVDGYFVTVSSARFADPGYTGTNDYFLVYNEQGDAKIALSGNPQNTQNPSALGNNATKASYAFAIRSNTAVPHEPGQVSAPGSNAEERVFFLPNQFFAGSGYTINGGTFHVALLSKDNFGASPMFTITPRYVAATAIATAATVNTTTGVTTITVAGTAYGPNAGKASINLFRTEPTNPLGGVFITSVTLNPNDPNHHYDKTTGGFWLTKTWNGLPDLVVPGHETRVYGFFAAINDGSNAVVRDPFVASSVPTTLTAATTAAATTLTVDGTYVGAGTYIRIDSEVMLVVSRADNGVLTVARAQVGTAAATHAANSTISRVPNFTQSVTSPNPIASIVLNSPSGLAPTDTTDTSPRIAFVKAAVDAAAPGGFSAVFAAGGPNIAISGSGLNLTTKVIVSVDRGGFVGTGTTAAAVSGTQSMITSQTFASPAAASSFLSGIRFAANSQFTGKSNVLVTVETTTATGRTFTSTLTIPILRNPFFLNRRDGIFFDTRGFYARVGVPFFESTGGYQLTFADGLQGDLSPGNTYRFEHVGGDLHGLTLTSTGKLTGTPTTATGPAGTWTEDFFSVAVYDKFGNSDIMTYPLLIAPDEGSFFPQPIDDTATVSQLNSGVHIRVLENDIVPSPFQRNSLHPVPTSQPAFGKVESSGDGVVPTIYYTIDHAKISAANIAGTITDTFQYRILQDTITPERIATVTVTITPFMVDTVNNLQDGKIGRGELSLLEAIQITNDKTHWNGRQIITFDPAVFSIPQTITLDTTALIISDDLTIIGPGADLLTINGNAGISSQGVFINYANTAISGLTITNGRRNNGGGILNTRAQFSLVDPSLTLSDCVITGNQAYFLEGGVPKGNGGGIENQYGTLTLTNCTISGNSANQAGGGINNSSGTVSILNSTISGNFAQIAGGGIRNFSPLLNGVPAGGSMTLTNVTISDNLAGQHGGGIANPGILTVRNSTIVNNGADSDNNSTSPDDTGGGVFTGDTAPAGFSNSTTLHNTIVAGNFINADRTNRLQLIPDDVNGRGVIDANSSFNLIGSVPPPSLGLVHGTKSNIVGNSGSVWNLDAILDRNLRDNGGKTLTHALIMTSPAVNKGSNAAISGTILDQRGSTRVSGSTVDIGAFEIDSDSLFLVNIDDGDADNSLFPNQTLTYTITFNQDVDAATVTAVDFDNAGTSTITIGTIAEPSPGVFTVQVTPTTTGSVVLRIPTTAAITSTTGKNLAVPLQDNDGLSVVPKYSGPLVVDTTGDVDDDTFNAGGISLREAVRLANERFGPDTITFAPGLGAIDLTLGQLTLQDTTGATTITGPAIGRQTIQRSFAVGTANFRVFSVATGAAANLDRLTVSNGSVAGPGAGIQNFGTLFVSNSVITGNTITNSASGGGIQSAAGSTLNINNSTISNNFAGGGGGGIINFQAAVIIANSLISGNFANNNGGGINNNQGTTTLTGVTVSGNYAKQNGGGINNNGMLTVTNSTITLNAADSDNSSTSELGGGIMTSAGKTTQIFNAIVAGNYVNSTNILNPVITSDDISGDPVDSASSFNLISDNVSNGGLVPGMNGNIVGNGNTFIEITSILDMTLRANGGPTLTHALVPGSKAINSGTSNVTTDQRGFPILGAPDIGAYEVQPLAFAPVTLADAKVNTAISRQFTASGPNLPVGTTFSYSVVAGSLPVNLNLTNAGLLTGTPGATGTFQFTVHALASTGDFAQRTYSLSVSDLVGPLIEREFSIGRDRGAPANIELRNANNTQRFTLTPFGTSFTGGIRTASGDVTGDGIADLICASGPGMPGTIRIFDGATQQPVPLPETVAGGGLPFGNTFTKGIIVAAGDLNADGLSDLIITAEAGGGARVRIFQSTGAGFAQRSDFIALIGGDNKPDAVKFRGGSRATVSDINGDGTNDLIWAAGAGGGPRVATFDGSRLDGGSNVNYKLTGDFFALSTTLRDGAYLAGGDIDGDGIGDLVAGGGSGAPPQVVGFSGATLIQNDFSKFLDFYHGVNSGQGIRVAVKDLNNDNVGDLILGSAPGAGSRVAAFNGKNLAGSNTGVALFDFDAFPGFSGGVFVG